MANLAETPTWETGIYRWETTDPVQGGVDGIDNVPTKQLANRTAYLKKQTDKLNMFIGLGGSLTWTIQELEKTIDLDTFWFGNTITINHTNPSYPAAKLILSVDGLTTLDRGYKIWIKKGTLSLLGLTVQVVNATAGGAVLAEMDPFTPNGYVYEFIFNGTAWSFNQNINEDLAGTIHAFGYGFPPAGFLACNGAAVSRTAYARLFSRISTTFGVGDGSTTFNLPDLRGEFIRGWDSGRGVDTSSIALACDTTNASNSVTVQDGTTGLFVGMAVTGTGIPANTTISAISSRTVITLSANATATGTGVSLTFTSARVFGSSQADMLKRHEHFYASRANIVNSASPTTATIIDWDAATTAEKFAGNSEYVGGAETRPRNVALLMCIKY